MVIMFLAVAAIYITGFISAVYLVTHGHPYFATLVLLMALSVTFSFEKEKK